MKKHDGMLKKKPKTQNLLYKFSLATMVVVLSIFVLLSFRQFITNRNLNKFAQEFDQIPLPANSKQIGSLYKVFDHAPTGSLCYYQVSKLIESNLFKDDLQEYFDKFKLSLVSSKDVMENRLPGGDNRNEIGVVQPWEETVVFGTFFTGSEKERKVKELDTQNNYRTKLAKNHSVQVDLVTDKIFWVFSSDYGHNCY